MGHSRQRDEHVLPYADDPDQQVHPPVVLGPEAMDAGALIGIVSWAWVDSW